MDLRTDDWRREKARANIYGVSNRSNSRRNLISCVFAFMYSCRLDSDCQDKNNTRTHRVTPTCPSAAVIGWTTLEASSDTGQML